MTYDVVEITFDAVDPYRAQGRRERVTFANPSGATWCEVPGKGVACIVTRAGTARFKSDFVKPEWRRKGVARRLMEYRLAWCDRNMVSTVTAFCTPLSLPLYESVGFKVVRMHRNGVAFVRKVL